MSNKFNERCRNLDALAGKTYYYIGCAQVYETEGLKDASEASYELAEETLDALWTEIELVRGDHPDVLSKMYLNSHENVARIIDGILHK